MKHKTQYNHSKNTKDTLTITIKRPAKKAPIRKYPSITFAYQLFLYKQEIRNASEDFSYIRKSRSKIMLTERVISSNIHNVKENIDVLKALSRVVQFNKRLTAQVERLEQFRKLGLKEVVLEGKKIVL